MRQTQTAGDHLRRICQFPPIESQNHDPGALFLGFPAKDERDQALRKCAGPFRNLAFKVQCKEDSSMSKLKNVMLSLVALMFMMIPASADPGCKTGKFVGSYTHPQTSNDIWEDSTGVNHTYLSQLNLQSDGTVFQYNTGFPDIMLNSGTGTPNIGSWTCRDDGKLVVTFIGAAYAPTTDVHGNPATVDLLLQNHTRVTLLFTVTDGDTLTRTEARARTYSVTQDPSNPSGGTLRPLNTSVVVYKRVVASDADLLAP